MNNTVLLADDDASIRFVVSKSLTKAGYTVRATDNVDTLLKWVKNGDGDVILTDVHMHQHDIFSFIPEIQTRRADLPIIIMSANTSVMTALKSGENAVFEYIPKPFDLSVLDQAVKRALGAAETKPAAIAAKPSPQPARMIGQSRAMQPVFRAISDYMSGDVPVYIYGAVGTGKSMAAALIHEAGNRKTRPIVQFDPYLDGDRAIENIENGDLLIDRLPELTADEQAVLLRLLERNDERPAQDKFRIITIADISIQELQTQPRVRTDLIYHIMGGQIYLPPLSARHEDIPELAAVFIKQADNGGRKTSKKAFTQAAIEKLQGHDWQGNVRELKNVIATIPLKYADEVISLEIIESLLAATASSALEKERQAANLECLRQSGRALLQSAQSSDVEHEASPYETALSWIEKPLIEEALSMTRGNNLKAAALLGIHRNTLRTKIKTLGIQTSIYKS